MSTKNKWLRVVSIVFFITFTLSLNHINAMFLTHMPISHTRAYFTPKWRNQIIVAEPCTISFYFEQLVIVDNRPVWVATETVYSHGWKDIFLQYLCGEGNYIYITGGCDCVTDESQNEVSLSSA